jgi:hypothetical protein
MKRTAAFFLLLVTPLFSEEVTIKQPAMLKSDRNMVSIKPGTAVELIGRDGAEITIRYKGLIGKIPAAKLEEPTAAATAKPD